MLKQIKEFAASCTSCDLVRYEYSTHVVRRGPQTFAVFGALAYDVTTLRFLQSGCGRICIPVDGRYLAEFPDEGNSGILGIYIVPDRRNPGRNRRSGPSFTPAPWVYTNELRLSDAEIRQNIIDEVARGENVWTNPPAGRV